MQIVNGLRSEPVYLSSPLPPAPQPLLVSQPIFCVPKGQKRRQSKCFRSHEDREKSPLSTNSERETCRAALSLFSSISMSPSGMSTKVRMKSSPIYFYIRQGRVILLARRCRRHGGNGRSRRRGRWLCWRCRRSLTVGMPSALVSLQTSETGSNVSSPRGWQSRKSLVSRRAPAGGETYAAVEVVVQVNDVADVEPVGGDEALAAGVLAALEEPGDVLVAGDEGVFRSRHARRVQRATQSGAPWRGIARGAEGVGERNEELAAVALLPELEDAILRGAEFLRRYRVRPCAASAAGSSWALVPMASRLCL